MKLVLRSILLILLSLTFTGSAAAEEIKLRSIGGVYTVPVRLNGQLTTDFMIDTGAADVGLSDEFAGRLLSTGVMAERDFRGAEKYTLADGSSIICRGLVLRSVRIGGHDVSDVKGSSCPGKAPLLLGQSFLKKLGPWALDYGRETLMVMSDVKKALEPPTYTPKDVAWQQNAVAQGDAAAQFTLAGMFFTGDGVPRDPKKSVELIQKSAAQGYAPAEAALAAMYEEGSHLPKSASKAVELYRKAAEQGFPGAQIGLGGMYRSGEGVPRDIAKALELYRRAAEHGDDVAFVNLGLMYEYGDGVPKDFSKAMEWYRRGADRGGLLSQYHLGMAYVQKFNPACDGGERDAGRCAGMDAAHMKEFNQGIEMIQKAAERGLPAAQTHLGALRWSGNAVPEDKVLGYAWCLVADARSSHIPKEDQPKDMASTTQENIAVMEKNLSPAERAEAKALASGWKAGQMLKRRGK